jgi:hypothetical protein
VESRIISDTVHWVQSNFGQHITKQELADKIDASGLPEDAKQTVRDLPNRSYTKEEVIDSIQDSLVAQLGAASSAMRGFGGSS